MLKDRNESLSLSYLGLRRLIGILGILLPAICIIGGLVFSGMGIQPSVSDYYHTNMRDFFIGLMTGISLFMATYKGYETRDIITAFIAAAGGFGIAFFPCQGSNGKEALIGLFQLTAGVSNVVHVVSASIFFIDLAVISMFLFTLSDKKKEERSMNKVKRNRIYVACGAIILVSLVSAAVCSLAIPEITARYYLVLLLETVMLCAFGVSWLVKGKTLYGD